MLSAASSCYASSRPPRHAGELAGRKGNMATTLEAAAAAAVRTQTVTDSANNSAAEIEATMKAAVERIKRDDAV